MAKVFESEFQHPLLGAVWFDDGKADSTFANGRDHPSRWICRPNGWETDFEIYLPGGESAPFSINAGLEALSFASEIEAEGRKQASGDVNLSWIDLTQDPPRVGFPDNDHIYVLWQGTLDKHWKIQNLTEGNW